MVAVLDSLRSMFGKSRDTVKGKYCKAIEAVADGKGSATEAMASVIHEMGKTLEEFEADVEEFRKRRAWVADIQKAVEARSRMDAPGVKFDMIGMVDEKFNADMRRIDEELREIRAGETSERISKDEASRLRKAANEEASEVNEARRARAYALRATIAAGEAAEGFLRMSAHQSFHDKESRLNDESYALNVRDKEWSLQTVADELAAAKSHHPQEDFPNRESQVKTFRRRLDEAVKERDRINGERAANREEMIGVFAFVG